MTQITTDTAITDSTVHTTHNAKQITGYKMKNKRSDNIIVASRKLFKDSKYNKFTPLLKDDHDIFLLPDTSNQKVSALRAHQVSSSLKEHLSSDYLNKTFIGLKEDVYVLFDLFLDHGIFFDTAILINGSYSQYPRSLRRELYDLGAYTKIYNFYTHWVKHEDLDIAAVNQYLPTIVPAQYSERAALEVFGTLVYGPYGRVELDSKPGTLSYL
jgi:hypothetical protein